MRTRQIGFRKSTSPRRVLFRAARGSIWLVAPAISCRAKGILNPLTWPACRRNTDEDVHQAAEYFAAQKPRTFVKVIESANPPRTFIATAGRHRQLHPDGGTEPIGRRILQIPMNPMATEIRDPHFGFLAYVPPGSIAKGEALVKRGSCALCHGENLKGLGEVPRLAGLQPVYVARQLFDIQYGSSAGKAVALMKGPVAHLTEDDIIAISAYLGSLSPE